MHAKYDQIKCIHSFIRIQNVRAFWGKIVESLWKLDFKSLEDLYIRCKLSSQCTTIYNTHAAAYILSPRLLVTSWSVMKVMRRLKVGSKYIYSQTQGLPRHADDHAHLTSLRPGAWLLWPVQCHITIVRMALGLAHAALTPNHSFLVKVLVAMDLTKHACTTYNSYIYS